MQPQVASEQDKMVPIDTSGDPVDVELKDDEKKEDSVDSGGDKKSVKMDTYYKIDLKVISL